MHEITVDTDVFAAIWSLRKHGEYNENIVLRRILAIDPSSHGELASTNTQRYQSETNSLRDEFNVEGKVRWIDDVEYAFQQLGGQATLHRIYLQVRKQREDGGRSRPPSLEAIVRRSIEEQSSDSEAYKGVVDIFENVGRGEWRLRNLKRRPLENSN